MKNVKRQSTRMLLTGLTALFFTTTVSAQTGNLTVKVTGIKGDTGYIMIGVGDVSNMENMLGNMVSVTGDSIAMGGVANIPTGKYPVYVFHDANANYQVDMTEMGIPKEGVAKPATVEVKEGDNEVEVNLIYMDALAEKVEKHMKSNPNK